MFPNIEDWPAFKERVELICGLILTAVAGTAPHRHVISVDEKTGIQALERTATSPVKPGKIQRHEYEYIRHGTTSLTAGINVATGLMESHRLYPTRTEKDFVKFMDQTCASIPKEDRVVLLLDQLNTHKSESLVCWVAKQIGFDGELGRKGYNGILKNQRTRMEFLENPQHRIQFVYTPKHCSWLNPIENWFGKLQRHVIKHGNFNSIKNLELKIEKYIKFYNKFLSKPYKWKFTGFIKAENLDSMKLSG